MSLGLLATPTVQICKASKMMFNVAPGNFYLAQYLEYQKANGTTATVSAMSKLIGGTDAAFVTTVLTNLGLAADAGASAFLTSTIAASGRGAAVEAAITALDGLATTDATYGAAKISFDAAVVKSVTYSTNIANNSSDMTVLAAAVDPAAIASGTLYTLTANADALTGGTSADTFNAVVDSTAANVTLSAADTLRGGTGIDTLNISLAGTATAVTNSADISGIEVVSVRSGGGNAVMDASSANGATEIIHDRGTASLVSTNLATDSEMTVNGNGTVVHGELAFTMKIATDTVNLNITNGTKMAARLTVKNATGGTATGTATTAVVDSTGAANTVGVVDLANASLTSVTINAATNLKGDLLSQATDQVGTGGIVTISGAATLVELTAALDNTIAVLNAGGLTAGGIKATLGSLVTQTVTGGVGDDTLTTGAVLTTGSVAAGAGTDKLILGSNVSHANTTALGAKYTGFETLSVNGTFDTDVIAGLTAIEVSGATNSITNLSAVQGAAIKAMADIGNSSLVLKSNGGTTDVMNITLGTGLLATAAANTSVLTTTGVETLNLIANPGPTATAGTAQTVKVTGAIIDATLTAVNLTGNAFWFTNIATTKAVTIDGTALTGDGAATPLGLRVAGSAKAASVIKGSEFQDTYTIGAEGSDYQGNGGKDLFTTTIALLVADGTTDGTISGGAGKDKLTLSDTVGYQLTDNHFFKLSGFEELTLTATGSDNVTISTGTAFNAAFPDGVTLTTGAMAATKDAALSAGLASVPIKFNLTSANVTGAASDTHVITTGSGKDDVSLIQTAWVGINNAAQGTMVIKTNAGDDKITVTTGNSANVNIGAATGQQTTITGGTGADTIALTGRNGKFTTATTEVVIASGDTGTTATTFDVITGFQIGAQGAVGVIGDMVNYTGTAAVGSIGTSTDFGIIKTHIIINGVATFDDAGSYATALKINSGTLADVVGYLAANTATADSVAFLYDKNGDGTNDGTMLYMNMAADGLVHLDGITVLGVSATITTATAGYIIIE
jgi:hypothetical protein